MSAPRHDQPRGMQTASDGRMIWWAMEIAGPTPRRRKKTRKKKPPLATLADARRKR